MQSFINYNVQNCNYTDIEGRLQSVLVGKNVTAHLECNEPLIGSAPNPNAHYDLMQSIKKYQGKSYVRGHLMNDHLGGIGEYYNLFPISYKANSEHKNTAEAWAKQALREEYQRYISYSLDPQKCFVDYHIEAVCNSNDLSINPTVDFICTASNANGASHNSKISSMKEGKGESIIEGRNDKNHHYDKKWSSNKDLYGWSASGRGESSVPLKSKLQSNASLFPVINAASSDLNVYTVRDAAIEYIMECDLDDETIEMLVCFINDATDINKIYNLFNYQ